MDVRELWRKLRRTRLLTSDMSAQAMHFVDEYRNRAPKGLFNYLRRAMTSRKGLKATNMYYVSYFCCSAK